MKGIQIWSFTRFIFSRFWVGYRDLFCKSSYSVQILENADQHRFRVQFLCSLLLQIVSKRLQRRKSKIDIKQSRPANNDTMSHLKKICFVPVEMTTSKRTLHKNCPNTEFFWSVFGHFSRNEGFQCKGILCFNYMSIPD